MKEREINREIDIDRLSKAMPYKPLEERYFEQLPYDTLAKLKAEEVANETNSFTQRWSIPKPVRAAMAAAAVVAVMVGVRFTLCQSTNTLNYEERQIAEFVERLSDSELESIISESESNYEFYTNL